MKVRYTGSPGYEFTPSGAAPFAPQPGDVLDLPAELVATLGDDFVPADQPAKKAPKADAPAPADGDTDPAQEG